MKTQLSSTAAYRSGFSIIEVLTSIVVAMIGVFGVMVLIPFAVKQAQTGLDSDAATIVARNAYAKFEIGGYRNNANWILNVIPPFPPTIITAAQADAIVGGPGPRIYSIDPLGVTEQTLGPDYSNTDFPFNRRSPATAYPSSLVIESANLVLPDYNNTTLGLDPMLKADSRRMFRAADQLEFGEAVDSAVGLADADLYGPKQIYDLATVDINGDLIVDENDRLRRQSRGNISWSAIVVPQRILGSNDLLAQKYRMYILVYKDRQMDVFNADPKVQMTTARVVAPVIPAAPVSTVTLESPLVIPDGVVRKDEWVMLTNRRGPLGVDQQIGFYRVVNFDGNDPVKITLDGPDFDFSVADSDGTHIVHLKDVVGVYERTFTAEGDSNWNISF